MTSRRGEAGAVLLETALTIPVVLAIIFAIVEFGFLFRDYTALRSIGQEAVRAATISGDDLDADFHLLEVILDASAPLPDDAITRIIVYRADGPHSPVPSACELSGQDTPTVQCNTYSGADLTRPATDFGCLPGQDLDRFWCPDERVVIQSAASGGPPDYIGVHLQLQRQVLTRFFGQTQQLSTTSVLRLEPRDI